jgi:hypothetical protein
MNHEAVTRLKIHVQIDIKTKIFVVLMEGAG